MLWLYKIANKDCVVELVTKDTNLRIKADVYDIRAKDYEPDSVQIDELYSGYIEIDVEHDLINEFYQSKVMVDLDFSHMYANQYVIMRDKTNPNHSAIGRFSKAQKGIVPLIRPNESIWGIYPKKCGAEFCFRLSFK